MALAPRAGLSARQAIVALLGVGVVVAMLLTSGQMADLRVALPPLGHAMNWLEMQDTPFDLDHVVFFALVAMAARVLLPRRPWWQLLLAFAVLAAGTELLQFGTVGRTPKLLDARDDLIGTGIGLALGALPLWCAGQAQRLLALSAGLLLGGIALLPFQQWHVASVFGFPVLPADALFVLALAVRGFAWAGGNAGVRISGFHGWLAAYVLAALLAVLVLPPTRGGTGSNGFSCLLPSPSFGLGLAKWIGVLYLALLAVAACDQASRPGQAARMAVAWVAAACLAALVSVCAVLAFYVDHDATWLQPLLNHYGSLPPGDYPRVRAGFNYASMFANFLLVGICVLLALRAQGRIGLRVSAAVLLLIALGAVPTFTPGLAGIPLALGLAAWWTWHGHAPARARAALAAGLLPAIAMLLVASRSLLSPLDTPSQRWMVWSDALATVWTHPWRGVGLGQDVAGVAYVDPSGGQQWLTDAHNIALNLAGQGGLPLLLAFAGLCAWLYLRGLRAARDGTAMAGGALLALVVAVLYDGLTGSFEDARHLWVLIGLLAGTALACGGRGTSRASTA